jgi:hypothetical protein
MDVLVPAGLVVGGVIVGGANAAESTKVSIGVLLGVVELIFVFSRVILHHLDQLVARTLTIMPGDLPDVLFKHLDSQRLSLMTRAGELSRQLDCDLEKHEMYAELIGLTDAVTAVKYGTHDASIYAISSTNIEDFERDPLAQEYLDANIRAVQSQVDVRRLFLLDEPQTKSAKIASIIKRHDAALGAQRNGRASVKWLRKSRAGSNRDLDIALFAREVLVRQALRPGGVKFELTVDEKQVRPVIDTFHRMWREAKTPAELPTAH